MDCRIAGGELSGATPLGHDQETSLGTATGLTTIPTGATKALIQAEAQNVRWSDDGVNPTTTTGMRLLAGESVMLGNLAALLFIEEAGSAKLNVSYYSVPVPVV